MVPIILFTYRRVPKETIDSLLKNHLSKSSELFIFSDGYKNDFDKQDVLNVRKYLKAISGFKNIKIFESQENKGLANNIISGVSKIINNYGKVIVLEDDLIVSTDFLEYMNSALGFYENSQDIWSISGYCPNMPFLADYDKDTFLALRGNSWGWATWKDRWDTMDWEIKDWKQFKRDRKAIAQFNLGGNDMFKMLELQMLGKIDSWAIRWCYNQFRQKRYTVYPTYSKICNIGFDDKGTHNSTGFDRWRVDIGEKIVNFENVEVNETILYEFKQFYKMTLFTRVGYLLRKYGGYKVAKKIFREYISR